MPLSREALSAYHRIVSAALIKVAEEHPELTVLDLAEVLGAVQRDLVKQLIRAQKAAASADG